MPFARIDTIRGRYSNDQRAEIGTVVYESLRSIGVPAEDRFQVLANHADFELVYGRNYLGIARSDGFIAIQITLNLGRSLEQKKALFAAIAAGLHDKVNARPQDVLINLVEVPTDNWSFGDGEAQYAS